MFKVKINKIFIISNLLLFFAVLEADAFLGDINLNRLVEESDIIIEGVVIDKYETSGRSLYENIDNLGTSLEFGIGTSIESVLKVTKVYKGKIKNGQTVNIFNNLNVSKDISNLKKEKEYLLFLKKQRTKNGFIVLNYGRGELLIFDYNGKKKIKAWYQDPRLRESEAYTDYDEFVIDLETKLSSLQSFDDYKRLE